MDTINLKNAIIEALMEVRIAKTEAGYIFRLRSGLYKDNFSKSLHPTSIKLRNNFGTVMSSGKLLRQTLNSLLINFNTRYSINKINSAIWKIVLSDKINEPNQKNAFHGDNTPLKNLDLNPQASLHTLLFVNWKSTVDREKGLVSLTVPSFNPMENIKYFKGATHFRIVSAAAELDFLTLDQRSSFMESDYLPIEHFDTEIISHEHQLNEKGIHTIILVLGLQYFQKVNGFYYQLLDRSKNGITIINVDQVSNEIKMSIKK